ncbi:MAG TPA: hypothetical protein VN642_00405 [Dongiaceae bacterium]|nr:hypothetical protein [Dongiaceae bacterium]
MTANKYNQVCYRTEQRDESVPLRNLKDGNLGFSFGCTQAGETVQVKLTNGELDSWSRDECVESPEPL